MEPVREFPQAIQDYNGHVLMRLHNDVGGVLGSAQRGGQRDVRLTGQDASSRLALTTSGKVRVCVARVEVGDFAPLSEVDVVGGLAVADKPEFHVGLTVESHLCGVHEYINMTCVQTGDVVLFKGAEGLLDRAISYFTDSPYTHVGLILRDPKGLPPGPYVIESSKEVEPDPTSGHRVIGVQIQPLSTILSAHGTASVRRLERLGKAPDLTPHLTELFHNVDGRPYDIDLCDWLRAEIRVHCPGMVWEQRDDTFWCSALAAYLYVKLGLLPPSLPWTLVSPKEWGPGGILEPEFIHCTLGEPMAGPFALDGLPPASSPQA